MHTLTRSRIVLYLLGFILLTTSGNTSENPQQSYNIVMNSKTKDSSTIVYKELRYNKSVSVNNSLSMESTLFLVTDAGDQPDDSLADGFFFPQTLRSAIENANLTPGLDFIIVDTSVGEISPLSPLPNIDYPIEINTFTLNGSSITPQVNIGQYGLAFMQGAVGSKVINGVIYNFPDAGILIYTTDMIVTQCIIHDNQGPGILGNAARRCSIGNTDASILGNSIYNNTSTSGDGIQLFKDIFGNPSDSNTISANTIGNIGGSLAFPNERNGIEIWGDYNRIHNNVISGNNYSGIRMGQDSNNPSTGNKIDLNRIGVTENFNDTLSNGNGNNGSGILIEYSQSDTIIDNNIGGNAGHGIEFLVSGNNAYISGNLIGVDTLRLARRENKGSGMFLRGNSNLIQNNIAGANVNGVQIIGDSNTVQSKYFRVRFYKLLCK